MPQRPTNNSLFIMFGLAACLTLVLATFVVAHWVPKQQETDVLTKLCTVQERAINENSGIVLSYKNPDAIWTHNDSGKPLVYLISGLTGETLAKVNLESARNYDWEDITRFQNDDESYVMVADVGDNLRNRKSYQLLTFPEPTLEFPNHEDPTVETFPVRDWTRIQFRYEDGSHNCESISVDYANGQIILLEKVYNEHANIPGVYIIDLPKRKTDKVLVARRVADIPIKNLTAMGISKDGNRIIARTYFEGFLYQRSPGQTWEEAFTEIKPRRIAMPLQRQGEGVCFSEDEASILCSSEFSKSPIWQVKIEEDE